MRRVVIKVSGESLGGHDECFDRNKISRYAREIAEIVAKGIEVVVVCGGGNLVRGRTLSALGVERSTADLMGMLGTVMNALALQEALRDVHVKAKAISALKIDGVAAFNREQANQWLQENYVLIFGGGVANPYFSTDSGAALRACELRADVILIGKHGVDGVYDSDPEMNKNARRYERLSFDDILKNNLKVIDATAASLCRDNAIKAFVFDVNKTGSLVEAALGTATGTYID